MTSPDGELGNQSSPASTLSDRDVAVFWHPCSQMSDYRDFPLLEIVGARGARLMLADGREVLDAISSWWCKSLGHGHAGVRARIEKQLARFEHIIAANTTHQALVELCERLLVMANTAPRGVDDQDQVSSEARPARSTGVAARPDRAGHFGKVFLADNGSTAVEVAMKMALQAQAQRGQPGRTKFAALAGGYHGETIATLSAGDLGLYADPYRPLMFPVHKLTPIPYRVGSHDPAWQDAAPEWGAIERALAPIAGELAAIIYEPVLQAAGGMRLYSPDLLRRLRKFADQHNVFLIADEIAAGMGRLGTMLASRLADQPPARPAGAGASEPPSSPAVATLPDFAVFSKGLTAGFLPLSAVLTTNEIYQHFYGAWSERLAFLHSNTYTANALAVAAALGALDAYDNEGVLAGVSLEGPRLLRSLTEVARTSRVLTGVRGLGMMAAVELCTRDGRPFEASARMGRQVFREAVKRGALLRPLGDTLYLFPPLNTPARELDAMVDILAASVAAVVPGG